jgi:hypothetical protein
MSEPEFEVLWREWCDHDMRAGHRRIYEAGKIGGRREALEDAAKIAARIDYVRFGKRCAAAIRAFANGAAK